MELRENVCWVGWGVGELVGGRWGGSYFILFGILFHALLLFNLKIVKLAVIWVCLFEVNKLNKQPQCENDRSLGALVACSQSEYKIHIILECNVHAIAFDHLVIIPHQVL